jgi:lysophospholipase L1-like esterase
MSRGLPLAGVWLGFPVLLTQGLRVRRTTLRLPDAEGPEGRVDGPGAPLRVLVVGDSVAAGVGVGHHRATIAGRVSTRLAESRGRAVTWRVVARTGATTGEVTAMLRDRTVPIEADVVVISIGVNDAKNLHTDGRFRTELGALVDHVLADLPQAEVLLLGLPPMDAFPALPRPLADLLGARARRIDAVGRGVAAGRPRLRRIELALEAGEGLFAEDGFHPSAVVHDRIAREVVALLAEEPLSR